MWEHYRLDQKVGYVVICGLLLVAMSCAGHKYLQQTPQVVLHQDTAVPQPAQPAVKPASQTFPTSVVPEPQEVVVHVAGAVNQPGVLHLQPSDRVTDAIAKAGGAAKDADLESINLAAKLVDGSQLYIPRKNFVGEEGKVAEPYAGGVAAIQPSYATSDAALRHSKGEATGVVRLNTASKAQLESLPGVGPATAEKIMQYRMEHGGFGSVEELLAVKGIGPKKLEAMRRFVKL